MNCREFTIEFEERNALSEPAILHLKICADCEKMSRRQTQVWQMIDGLQRVDAPKTFDFTVKARIANSRPADFQPRFLPVLRYVLPVGVIVLIFGFIFLNSFNFSRENAAPQLAENTLPMPIQKEVVPSDSSSNNQVAVANTNSKMPVANVVDAVVQPSENNREKPFVIAGRQSKSQPEIRKRNVKDDFGGGSRTSAATSVRVITPKNLNANKTVISSPNLDNAKSFTAGEILLMLGIESVSENGKLQVKTIKQDSSAERSDVKVGDVIEAIDGRKISDEPFRGTFEGKTLTVMRGTKKIEIVLQN